ncbi:MAG: ComEA family DNA-binding protein [Chloroflexota bacterium]|nr:ComEA family DNA-binding protein [Chloroflexota bacterium]
MDRIAEWRPVEPVGPEGAADRPAASASENSSRQGGLQLVGVGLLAVAAVLGAALVLFAGTPRPPTSIETGVAISRASADAPTSSPTQSAPAEIIVDVEGAVERPGLHRLPSGSRVGDAVRAAGGYSAQVDIGAAARRLNLAAVVSDGEQVYVPLRGEEEEAGASTSPGAQAPAVAGPPDGLIDVNTASAAQLETLPGIGPVTAAKILGARDEAPFETVDDLLARKVVGPATMEKIRALITVGR